MDEEVELPKFYFSFEVKILKFLGIDVLNKTESFFYRIYTACILGYTSVYVFSEFLEFFYYGTFKEFLVCIMYFISHFLGMLKVAVFYTNRKEIGDLMVSLHEGVFTPDENRGGNFEKRCIMKTIRLEKLHIISYALSIIIVIGLGLYLSMYTRVTRPEQTWRLPFITISYISNTTYTPLFETGYAFQMSGMSFIATCVYSADITVVAIIAQTSAQLKIFENSVRNYETRALKTGTNTESKNKPLSANTLRRSINRNKESQNEEQLANTLYNSVDHHLLIIEIVETVERVCSYLILCVFLANLILLCLIMYYTSMMPLFSAEFFQYLDYCVLVIIQVFMFCYWGNEMTLANESLALGAAQTYNPYGTINRAKALKLMIIRAQRPLILTAGKFVPLSLETFKGIIKGSFSYFMVLRRMNIRE